MDENKFCINKLKLYIIFFFIIIIHKYNFSKTKFENMKKGDINVALCTLGKKENLYIKEFSDHYKNMGVNKIYLYDNNDINGEKFEDEINDYINDGFIEIINVRGLPKVIKKVMNDCYQKNYDKYEWLIFYEIDEFIYLKNYSSIKSFLNQPKFNKCQKIYLNWFHRSDNNLIYYDNRRLSIRFTKEGENIKKKKNYLALIKTIIRGHIHNITITDIHRLNLKIKGCDGFGRIAEIRGNRNIKPDYKYYYINHYYSKSTEEFCEKLKRGDMQFGNSTKNYLYQIQKYFIINKITSEKIDFLEKRLGINLFKYRIKISKKI